MFEDCILSGETGEIREAALSLWVACDVLSSNDNLFEEINCVCECPFVNTFVRNFTLLCAVDCIFTLLCV